MKASRPRSARALYARRACEAREKKPTVHSPYNEFVLTWGVQKCHRAVKISLQLLPLCKFDTPGDWFCKRIVHVIFYAWLHLCISQFLLRLSLLGLLRGICSPWRHSWGWAFTNPGPPPSFWHAHGFVLEYNFNYTEDFTEIQADWLICQG